MHRLGLYLLLGLFALSGCQKSPLEVGRWASPAAKQAIGQPFGNFELPASPNTQSMIQTKDFAGKPVLLIFWATWCQPCLQKVREIQKHREFFSQKSIQLLSISVDENPAGVPMVQRSLGIDWPVATGGQPLFDQMRLDALPQSFLLDANGDVLDAFTGSIPLEQELDAIAERLSVQK